MEALSTSVAKQSAASQVWGIGHLREAILDNCAKLFTSPVQKSQFFRRCISGLDKRSVRECARHTHASVNLNDFPWDCPDSDRLRWYAMGVKRLNMAGSLPLCHRWTLAALLEQFPNVDEIGFPIDWSNHRFTTLYRPGHAESCAAPDKWNFITKISLSPAQLPSSMFFAPTQEELEHVHYYDVIVTPDVFDMDTLMSGNTPSFNLMRVLASGHLPPILDQPIRWLSFETSDGMLDAQLWINLFRVRKQHSIPTLGIDTGSTPQYVNYFNVLSEDVGADLRWVHLHEVEMDLGAVFDVFTEARYPKLESMEVFIEPGGDFGEPFSQPIPPNLKKVHIELSVYTFTLNQPESRGLFPEDRLPLKTLRRLKEEMGPDSEITVRVITNYGTEGPKLQALVNEAVA